MTIDRTSHSYLLGLAEADGQHLREVLRDLVAVTKDDLLKLPEGYRGRRAIDQAIAALSTGQDRRGAGQVSTCQDCNRPYGKAGFPDLIIPYWAWKQISPTGDDGGLLCPSCICARLEISDIHCEGAFMSGPITSVSSPTMNVLRRVENIELAIEGRDNKWAGIRSLTTGHQG